MSRTAFSISCRSSPASRARTARTPCWCATTRRTTTRASARGATGCWCRATPKRSKPKRSWKRARSRPRTGRSGAPGPTTTRTWCRSSNEKNGVCPHLNHRAFVLVAPVALDRAHELVALRAEPHDEGARHQHRGVDAEADADGEGEREVVQRRAAEDEHRAHHHLRAAVRDDGARDHPGDGAVDDLGGGGLAHLAEVL